MSSRRKGRSKTTRVSRKPGRTVDVRWRAVIDAAPFGAYTFRLVGRDRLVLVAHNKEAERIIPIPHVALLGCEIVDAFPSLRGTDVPAKFRNVAETGESYSRDVLDYADGRINGAFEFFAVKTGRRDMTVFFRDITARRKVEEEVRDSERRYREMFDSNPHPMWVYDLETLRFLAVNDATVARYGYSREEFLGMTIKDIRPHEEVPRLLRNVERARHQTGLDEAGIWKHRYKDGSLHDVDITSHTLTFDGRAAELVLAHDMTEQRRVAALMREAQEVLEKRVAERTADLQAVVSALREEVLLRQKLEGQVLEVSDQEQRRIGQDLHDGICQMLTAIAFLSDSLEQRLRGQGNEAADRAARIKQLTERAISESRRVARGLHPVQLEEIGLMAALRDLADSHSSVFGVQCRFECNEEVTVPEMAKAIHLYRIAQEACSNAQRHGKATEILISLHRTDGGTIRLLIDDNGAGGVKPGGRGMGLRIMNFRAAAMNADLQVLPRTRGGTRILCVVPPEGYALPIDEPPRQKAKRTRRTA